MTDHSTLVDRYLARAAIKHIPMNVRTLTPTELKRLVRADNLDFCRTSHINAIMPAYNTADQQP